ncbi:MAG TPA: transglutaminase family protein [Opitutales bacterium]|nr:transglutaminase family protein [Opitutales bacterium]
MAIHAALSHRTHYRYDRPVTMSPQVIRLRPAPHTRTPVLSYSLKVEPAGHFLNWQQDPHGNYQARVVFPETVREFKVEVDVVAEMAVHNPFDFFVEPYADKFPFEYDAGLKAELAPYLPPAEAGPLLKQYLEGVDLAQRNTVSFLVDLNNNLRKVVDYIIRLEPGVQTPEETLKLGKGSCRDSAWLLVQILRNLGLAARFVSGYLIQLKPDVKSLDGPSGTEVDFTDLHAWTEVFLPGAGWIGFDPTSGLLAGEGHIPLAATPVPSSAAPISGGLSECKTEFEFHMDVKRVYESPRVTKPYTEEQWEKIESLGHRIDEIFHEQDLRLTMGGEPTFISIDDMEGPEWNTVAVGPRKRDLSATLIKRLQDRFAPGGMLHWGLGKWYPGESLPRWSFASYWRKDGTPIWENPELAGDYRKNYGFDAARALVFARHLASQLGVEDKWLMPAYEDAWYYLWKERKLPANVDPLRNDLRNPEDRKRLAKVFEDGLDAVKGYVMPLQRRFGNNGPYWLSGPWFLRQEHCFLIPGDFPIGYRLPVDSAPWVAPGDYPHIYHPDPLSELPPLPTREELLKQMRVPGAGQGTARVGPGDYAGTGLLERARGQTLPARESLRDPAALPRLHQSAGWIVRTALCVEPREGKLFVFMPPVPAMEDYLDLVARVEAAADAAGTPVLLEGYPPPFDYRVNVIKVTPDPGVIEVNTQPAHNWNETVDITTGLYEEAHRTRLGTEKFMIDGRHTGTGGGNHIVLGGPSPAESPLLRRPDLLGSLIAYWHQHPSLSYLFSGLFIGPTSQAPRVDEARNDSIYELEIALAKLREARGGPPWIVDRILRNLLIDVTGNTHRAEFCMDKLYSPDGPTGRLGLLELRAFEMPPHARMSLAQQLLLRGLVARFAEQPYEPARLTRWGTELHDRWMLPHFVQQDFNDVLAEMREHGLPFADEWFAPHYEFKFPFYGKTHYREVDIELRHALEPWNVLGETGAPGGAVRYVDSSVERLQVRARGLNPERYVVACNGRRVPLHPTGTVGEYVAGVRYRAWQPPECLHPTIPVDAPLTFDLIDTWNQRPVAGCIYHVSHPSGRNYVTFPVNAYEAESRRLARFFDFGHTPGMGDGVPPLETQPEFPFTLDLRATPTA